MISVVAGASTAPLLPKSFEDLEAFARDWALPTEQARLNRRLTAGMEAITAFHNAILPRVENIFAYLDQYPLDALPEDAQRLMLMALSLAEITPVLHFYNEPMPSDVYDASRFKRWDIPHMTPKI